MCMRFLQFYLTLVFLQLFSFQSIIAQTRFGNDLELKEDHLIFRHSRNSSYGYQEEPDTLSSGQLLLSYSDSGDIDKVRALLLLKVDPNFREYDGITPLMLATQNGHYEVAKLLLDSSANPNLLPLDGNSALHAAVRAANDSIAELLINYQANVNQTNTLDLTPLHYSVWFGLPYITDLLLYNGADPNKKDFLGNTPLIFSVYNGTVISSQLLLEYGADPNLCNIKGVSPFMIASQYNDTLLANLLISYGADINLKNSSGYNALSIAINNNSKDMLDLLIKIKADTVSLSKSYYQIAAETDYPKMKFMLDSLGLKTKLKPFFSNVFFTSGMLFNNHEFMLGFNFGVVEQVTKLSASLGVYFRPTPVATLDYQNSGIYQFREKRRVVELKVSKSKAIKVFPTGNLIGAYYGANLDFVSRDFNATDNDPKSKIYFGLNAGLFCNVKRVRLNVGWDFTRLKTPQALNHRIYIGLQFLFPTKGAVYNKTIYNHVY
ncbi:MAG: hypothetical protein F9K37_02755 [Bacteroidales bacterium]|nr:MAG: hypothetical protein F9K37_02755 [Bacteroidales bacterium]